MFTYKEFKSFYLSNIILFIVLLFIIVYVVINWDVVYQGNYWSGIVVKPILITGIVFLVCHMMMTWDDEINQSNSDIAIPKYKFGQSTFGLNKDEILNQNINSNPVTQIVPPQVNIAQNIPANSNPNIQTQLNSKYKISNRFDTNPFTRSINDMELNIPITHPPIVPTNKLTDSKLSNQNIFISHKNVGKYGLKF